jgi:hypothetical protein
MRFSLRRFEAVEEIEALFQMPHPPLSFLQRRLVVGLEQHATLPVTSEA